MIHDQCISALRAVNSNLDYSFVPTSRLKQLSLSMLVIWQNVVGNIGQYDSSDEMWGLRIFPYFICKTSWLFWQQVFYVNDWITPDLSGVFLFGNVYKPKAFHPEGLNRIQSRSFISAKYISCHIQLPWLYCPFHCTYLLT